MYPDRRQVVVLIDEYDKPLLQAVLNAPLLDAYRRRLKAFYGVLKSADRYLRFVFLIGVTKFAQVSVFSDLNQLQDISAWSDYSSLCGIAKEELVRTFTPEIERLGGLLEWISVRRLTGGPDCMTVTISIRTVKGFLILSVC